MVSSSCNRLDHLGANQEFQITSAILPDDQGRAKFVDAVSNRHHHDLVQCLLDCLDSMPGAHDTIEQKSGPQANAAWGPLTNLTLVTTNE